MSPLYFFIIPLNFSQAIADIGLGPFSDNEFQSISKYRSNNIRHAYTICKGHLPITPQIDTQRLIVANKANLMITQAEKPFVDSPKKYRIYNSFKLSCFINSSASKEYSHLKLALEASYALTIKRQQVTKYETPTLYYFINDAINNDDRLDIKQIGLIRKEQSEWMHLTKVIIAFTRKSISSYIRRNCLKKLDNSFYTQSKNALMYLSFYGKHSFCKNV